jgi:hypothetical protein
MTFRRGYDADEAILTRLRDIHERVWLTVSQAGDPPLTYENIASLILTVHEMGIPLARLEEQVIGGIMRPILLSRTGSLQSSEQQGQVGIPSIEG